MDDVDVCHDELVPESGGKMQTVDLWTCGPDLCTGKVLGFMLRVRSG